MTGDPVAVDRESNGRAKRVRHVARIAELSETILRPIEDVEREHHVRELAEELFAWARAGTALPDEPVEHVAAALVLLPPGLLVRGAESELRHAVVLARAIRGTATMAELERAGQRWVEDAALAAHPFPYAVALAFLASDYERLGRADQALQSCDLSDEQLSLVPAGLRDGGFSEIGAFVAQTRAAALLGCGENTAAARAYVKAYALVKEPAYILNVVSAWTGAGRLRLARRLMDGALPRCTPGQDMWPWRAGLAALEGDLLAAEDRPEAAVLRYGDALDVMAHAPDPDLLWQVQLGLARCAVRLGDLRGGLRHYLTAANVALVARGAPLGVATDSSFLRERIVVFEEGCALAARLGEPVACLYLMELVKSHTLTRLLAMGGPSLPDSPERVEALGLSAQIDDLDLELARTSDATAAERVRQHREKLVRARQRLIERQRRDDPRWHRLTMPVPLDVDVLLTIARERRQSALGLFTWANSVCAVLVDPEGLAVACHELSEQARAGLAEYVGNLTDPHPDSSLFDPVRAGLSFAGLVPGPLISRALAQESLLVSAHGSLHVVPWAMLGHGRGRLIEQTGVGLLPNLSCLLLLSGEEHASREVTLIGAPGAAAAADLPGLSRELNTIWQAYGGPEDGRPVTGAAATQAAVLEAMTSGSRDSILHLAVHGRMDPESPTRCGLELSDGLLDVGELATSSIARSEVVLSACCTGWRPFRDDGIPIRSDDVLGIPGALLEAGVSSSLLSITPAEDRAMRLVAVDYHGFRRTGETPIAAAAQAMRRRLAASDPAWGWCGVVVYGSR